MCESLKTTQSATSLFTAGKQALSVLVLLLLCFGFQPQAVANGASIAAAEAKKQEKAVIRHQQLKGQISQRLGRHYGQVLVRPDQHVLRKLALFHPYSREVIPLFGSRTSATVGQNPVESKVLPVDATVWNAIKDYVADLEKGWLFVLTDTDDNPLRFLGTGQEPLEVLPGYHPAHGGNSAYIDLVSLLPPYDQEVLGITDITVPNGPIVTLGAALEPGDDRVLLHTPVIEALRALPDSCRERLVLVTAIPGPGRLRLSRLLIPLNSLSTNRELLTPAGELVLSPVEPVRQLDSGETAPRETPSRQADNLLLSTPVTGDEHYRVDLVIEMKDGAGHPFYHRICGIRHPDQWYRYGTEMMPKETQLRISASRLLELAGSSHLRYQQLYLMEHSPANNRQALYPLGRTINNQLLALEAVPERRRLEQLLKKPGPKDVQESVYLTLPHHKPSVIAAPTPPDSLSPPSADQGTLPIDLDIPGAGVTQPEQPATGTTRIYYPRELRKPAELTDALGQAGGGLLSYKGKGKKNTALLTAKDPQPEALHKVIQGIDSWLSNARIQFSELEFAQLRGLARGPQLALYHTPSGAFIPLLEASKDGDRLTVPEAFFDSLTGTLSLSDGWLLAITRPAAWGMGARAMLPTCVHSLANKGMFHSAYYDKSNGSYSLDWSEHLEPGEQVLAIADITRPDPPLLVLPTRGNGTSLEVDAQIIGALQKLPQHNREKLALVTANRTITPPHSGTPAPKGLCVSRLLMPLSSLVIDRDSLTSDGYFILATDFSGLQKKTGQQQPSADSGLTGLYNMLAMPAPVVRHQAVVISAKGANGKTIYHRLGSLLPHGEWEKNPLLPGATLSLPLKILFPFLSMPAFEESRLYVADHMPLLSPGQVEYFPLTQPLHDIIAARFKSDVAYRDALDAVFHDANAIPALDRLYLRCYLPSLSYYKTVVSDEAREWSKRQHEQQRQLQEYQRSVASYRARVEKQQGFVLDITQARKIDKNHQSTQAGSRKPGRPLVKRVADLEQDPRNKVVVDNANKLNLIDAEKAQREKDRQLALHNPVTNPAANPLIPDRRLLTAKGNSGPPSANSQPGGPPEEPKPKAKQVKWDTSKEGERALKVQVSGAPRVRGMLEMRAEQEQLRRQNMERQAGATTDHDRQVTSDASESSSETPAYQPTEREIQEQLAPHIELSAIERAGRWLGSYITTHPVHTAATAAAFLATCNLIRQWWQLPTAQDLLIKETIKLMGASAPPFWHEVLNILVHATPEHLLDLWTPDRLHAWIEQCTSSWCSRNHCDARMLSEIFVYYVLSPVSADRDHFIREIRLRISGEPADMDDPWQKTVAFRCRGVPAVLDFNPVTGQEWMAELSDLGLMKKVDAHIYQTHLPVKVFRRSFLQTLLTYPQHERYQTIINQGQITDVTNQYRPKVVPYPLENQRFGDYTCTTVDGDTWHVLDQTSEEPGMHALPALIAYAHEAKGGKCHVPSMDLWLSLLTESGQVVTLSPEPVPTLPVTIDLADILGGERKDSPDKAGNKSCSLQFWKNRSWQTLATKELQPGLLDAVVPRYALFRLRCQGETALFTVDEFRNRVDLLSWPPTANAVKTFDGTGFYREALWNY